MSICWITPLLGTAAAGDSTHSIDVTLVDVRELVDGAGNGIEVIREKIRQGAQSVAAGCRTVVCCDYGMSRSNAIAVGILASAHGLTFEAALRIVEEASKADIKPEPLATVRRVLGVARERPAGTGAVLITGGSGFVGNALTNALMGNRRVVTTNRVAVDLARGATQLDLLVKEGNVRQIVHLAHPRVAYSNTAVGESLAILRNLIDVCVVNDVPLVFPSSSAVYAGYRGEMIADEAVALRPHGPFGEGKYLAEILLTHSRSTRGLRCAILRFAPIYGPGASKPKFLWTFAEMARESRPIVTHRYANGLPMLDLLYIDDVVSALTSAIDNDFVGELNIGTGVLTSTADIAARIRDLLHSDSEISQIAIDSRAASIGMNWGKATTELSWTPRIDLDQGLSRTLLEQPATEVR